MTFSKRLQKAYAASGLTLDELAVWLGGVSRQVAWTWTRGRQPKLYRRPQVEEALGFLEKELRRQKPRLPLSLGMRLGERLKNVRDIRNSYNR